MEEYAKQKTIVSKTESKNTSYESSEILSISNIEF